MTNEYKKAGVDIDLGNEFVKQIKDLVSSTSRNGVMGSIGGFGGLFALDKNKYQQPVLISGTDGVGTKLKIAIDMHRFDTVGQDLVAMCVNDIACSGAEPLFFLDYFATGKLDASKHVDIIRGIASACKTCKCALIGGETAEMPGMYAGEDFDLAGFAVGIVEKEEIIDGHTVGLHDAIIGISSSGFHSNGYSLVRHIVQEKQLELDKTYEGFTAPLGEMLLTPTKLYSPLIMRLKSTCDIKAVSHITGGGLTENVPRVLPSSVQASIKRSSWEIPSLMRFFQELGRIDDEEMFKVFNCGIGLVLVVPKNQAETVCNEAKYNGDDAWIIGKIEKRVESPIQIN